MATLLTAGGLEHGADMQHLPFEVLSRCLANCSHRELLRATGVSRVAPGGLLRAVVAAEIPGKSGGTALVGGAAVPPPAAGAAGSAACPVPHGLHLLHLCSLHRATSAAAPTSPAVAWAAVTSAALRRACFPRHQARRRRPRAAGNRATAIAQVWRCGCLPASEPCTAGCALFNNAGSCPQLLRFKMPCMLASPCSARVGTCAVLPFNSRARRQLPAVATCGGRRRSTLPGAFFISPAMSSQSVPILRLVKARNQPSPPSACHLPPSMPPPPHSPAELEGNWAEGRCAWRALRGHRDYIRCAQVRTAVWLMRRVHV